MKLYELANEFAALSNSDMEPEMIADTLEGLDFEIEVKIENCLALIKNELADAEALKAEAAKLTERARMANNRVDRIKEYIAASLETAGKKSLKAGVHQVSIRAPSKSVEIMDSGSLPPELVDYETLIKPDKLAIKKQLEAGIAVPGAQIKTGKPSLIIK